jgi:ABC-type branched-subunit amino acid transport system substrate-binding protein
MLRFFSLLVIIFLISSCQSQPDNGTSQGVIPDEKIIGMPSSQENNIRQQTEQGQVNIALLAPINSNKNQIGQFILKAAQISVFDANDKNINLFVFDSSMIESDPQLLLTKLRDHSIKIIVGPVYSSDTEKLIKLVTDKDITILSLSNDSSVKSDNLLTMGITPDSQTQTILNYAISQGIDHFYLLLPSNKYGKIIDNMVSDIISNKNETTYSVTWYSQENAEQAIEELVSSISNHDNGTKAIFMPQMVNYLTALHSALVKYNTKIILIGNQTFEQNNISKMRNFNQVILLKNKLSDNKFDQRFFNIFASKPNNLDYITYNIIAMIARMHKENLALNKQSIINNNQIFDSSSPVKFNSHGLSLYDMDIVELHDGAFKIMDKR